MSEADAAVTIFGYGSLMDQRSCCATLPTATNFRPGELQGYRRSYNLVSVGRIKAGIADTISLEMAALSIAPCSSEETSHVLGCLFEILPNELGPYLEREHRYQAQQLEILDSTTPCGKILAWTVVEQTDAEYAEKLEREGLDWEEVVGQYYRGQLWGRRDVLPLRAYMAMCVVAAHSLGGAAYVNNMLDCTVLADGETSLRKYITQLLADSRCEDVHIMSLRQFLN